MQTPLFEIISFVFTFIVLGGVGYLSARRFKQPVAVYNWVLLILATILAGFVGIGGHLISVFGFTIYLNWCLQAFGLGLIIGLVKIAVESRLAQKSGR
jgi:hypothetical protein